MMEALKATNAVSAAQSAESSGTDKSIVRSFQKCSLHGAGTNCPKVIMERSPKETDRQGVPLVIALAALNQTVKEILQMSSESSQLL